MKLDPRIILLTDIITCFDTGSEKTKKNIGKKGYFSFRLGSFYDLSICDYGTLDLIDTANRNDDHGSDDVFHRKENDCYYSFFIPDSSLLKPKEKKYRPYTFKEFKDIFTIGQPIKYRRKAYRELIHNVMFIGYREDNMGLIVLLGNAAYSLEELFEQYEYFFENGKTWVPFGVEVEE